MVGNGQVVGEHYVLGEPLGSGRTGVVYEAVQRTLGRTVALKLPRRELRADPSVRERYRVEALAGSRVRHPSIVTVFDLGVHEGAPFLVTEHVPGRLLGELATRARPLELGAIVEVGAQLLAALAELHAAGVIHGDVRCDNVLVEPLRTGEHRARLFDFGSAWVDGASPLGDGVPAPGRAVDLHGIGALLYELLTGVQPPPDEPLVPPSQRLPERALPAALDTVVLQALAPDPADQFRDALTCAAALRAAVSGAPTKELARTGSGPVILAGLAGPVPATGRGHVVDSAQILLRREAVEDAILAGDDEHIVAA